VFAVDEYLKMEKEDITVYHILLNMRKTLRLNYEWLEEYFYVEPVDVEQLSDPQSYILSTRMAITCSQNIWRCWYVFIIKMTLANI
jgi:hypothetical protein